MMKTHDGPIDLKAKTRDIDVDNRFPLRNYYRIADSLLKQANIYREEGNIIDLHIMLVRFSSLVAETIPSHRDYQVTLPKLRSMYMKKLPVVLTELESIKPEVDRRVAELNKAYYDTLGITERISYNSDSYHPQSAHSTNQQIMSNLETSQLYPTGRSTSQASSRHKNNYQIVSSNSMQIEKQFQKLSFGLPPPKEETLSRHSIFGPNGLRGKWPEPTTTLKVQYPSKIDSTPVEISGLQSGPHDPEVDKSTMDMVLALDDGRWSSSAEDSCSSGNIIEELLQVNNIRQPSPPPVLAELKQHDYHPIHPSQVADPRPGPAKSMPDEMSNSNSYQHLHIPVSMMDAFLRLAQANTKKNLETCGVLAGKLKNRVFHITTLIIPKQEATSDSCSTMNEEEIFEFQDKLSLFPLGWIHTHPSQTCFMSSVDLHTHYSYQIMLPEAIAIVMAPTDTSRQHGIFHLSDPGGVSLIRNCQQRGFHPHEEPSDGSPIYEHCSHVYMNPKLKFEIADLR
ncbi:hypothetical protein MKW92_034239 [Papaver armeniacum]|nr:hypothetical protein MKW92_034239 [Papaver armeniacum]